MREPDPLSTVPGSPGLWRQINSDASPAATPRPAIFLDRDGVVVAETNYLHRIEDMEVLSGAAETIRLCNASRIPVILVTNQSGVGGAIMAGRNSPRFRKPCRAILPPPMRISRWCSPAPITRKGNRPMTARPCMAQAGTRHDTRCRDSPESRPCKVLDYR